MKKRFIKIICYINTCLFSFNKVVLADNEANINCNNLGKLETDLNNFFNLIKILVPLLIIGLSSYDFIKAITQKDDKDVKKAFSKLITRLICAVALFFLPIILNFFLNLIIDTSVCVGIE